MNANRYLTFAAAFMLLTAWMLKVFLPGIVWGAVFAISLWPLFEWATHRFDSRVQNPALLFSVLFAVVFVLPLAYVVYDVVDAYRAGSSYLAKNKEGIVPVPAFVEHLPYAHKLKELWVEHIGHSDGLLDILNQVSDNQLTKWLSAAALQLSSGIVNAICMLVSFYFMLKDGHYIKSHYEGAISHWFSNKSVKIGRAHV